MFYSTAFNGKNTVCRQASNLFLLSYTMNLSKSVLCISEVWHHHRLQSMPSRCEVWHHHRQDASEHAVQMWSVTSSSARCFRACRPDVKCDIIIDKMFQSMPSRCEVWHHHRQDVSEHAVQMWSVTSSSVSEHAVQMWSVTSSSARCFRACRPDENHDFSVILHLFVY